MRKLLILTGLMITSLVGADSENPNYINKYAKLFKLDPELLMAICTVESHCNPTALNHNDGTIKQKTLRVKSKSYGMFQIKLATARSLGFRRSSKDLLDPDTNTYYAAKLLNTLYIKYKYTKDVVSAYNAGKPVTHNTRYVGSVFKKYVTFKIDRKRK